MKNCIRSLFCAYLFFAGGSSIACVKKCDAERWSPLIQKYVKWGVELHSCEQFLDEPVGYKRKDFIRDQFINVQNFSGSIRQLADVCRTDIILSLLEKPDVVCKIDVGNITDKMRGVLCTSIASIGKIWQGEREINQSEVLKAALISSVELKLDQIVDVFFELFSDGVFHNYNLEEALFVLCIGPQYPGRFSSWLFSSKYDWESSFYVNCVAGAVKTWMKKILGVDIGSGDEVAWGESYAKNILGKYFLTVKKRNSESLK